LQIILVQRRGILSRHFIAMALARCTYRSDLSGLRDISVSAAASSLSILSRAIFLWADFEP